ncbi:hypothetical protein VTK56DRAFT_15 [Thermocarpiscus australiensis]
MFAQPRVKRSAPPPPPPKKRKRTHAVEEITFDKDARAEYLTGFRKRKQARIKHAQEVAQQKERQARIEMRKQIREQRRQAVEEHVQTINKILREAENAGKTEQDTSEEEWQGLSDTDVPEAPIDLEEEYIDEDKYTTVTVETVNVARDGLHKPELDESSDGEISEPESEAGSPKQEKAENGTAKRTRNPTQKKKKKKFRYETKFERDLAAQKQRAKRRKR